MSDYFSRLLELISISFKENADIGNYLLFIILALWGGTVRYMAKIKKGAKKWSGAELIFEWIISGFSGVIVALIGQNLELSFYMIAASSGVAGHMGGSAISIIEEYFTKKINKLP